MKKKSIIGLALLSLLLMTGCTKNKSKQSMEEALKQSEWITKDINAEPMSQVGNQSYGYLEIPTSWSDFYEANSPGYLQYSNETGTIISLSPSYPIDEQNELATYLETIEMYHQSLGAETTTTETVTIQQQPTTIFFSSFNSGIQLKTYLYVNGNTLHIIRAEGLPEDVEKASTWIENTYQTEK